MIRLASLLVALPLIASAQLQLLVAPPDSEQPVAGVFDCGSVAAGDRLDTRFRIRNTGTTAINVTAISVFGFGFSTENAPSTPNLLAARNSIDFTVRFVARDFGQYSANLVVNGINVLLRANVLAGVSVTFDGVSLRAGETVDFGRTERGTAARKRVRLENATSQTVGVQRVEVSGAHFELSGVRTLPVQLTAGESLEFDVVFTGLTAGVFAGSVVIDARTFRVTAAATEPPFDRPAVALAGVPSGSAAQGRVSVVLPKPSRARGTGVLRISYVPVTGATANDPAVLFLSTGRREVTFTVEEGDTEARFGAARETVFQTGTTAGEFALEARIGGFTEQATFTVAAAPVKIDAARGARNGGMLELNVTAFDNTYATTGLAFTFYDQRGQAIAPGAIRVDPSSEFRRHYAGDRGGSFSLKAVFPVAGPIQEIAEAAIAITNGIGTTTSERVRF